MREFSDKDRRRFESKFRVTPGCWLWMYAKQEFGYGQISFGARENFGAHRVAYQMYVGEIPCGLFVCHRCDNPSCVNPDHLFLGTHRNNMEDKAKKGRSFRPSGRKHGMSKLTDEIVLAIRSSTDKQKILSETYGVSQSVISRIKNGKMWHHI